MTLRKLIADDAAAFKALRLEAVQIDPTSFYFGVEDIATTSIEEFQAQIAASAQTVIFGAFDANELVAIAGLRRENREKIKHKALIWGVYTKPAYRGRGIARQLIAAALEEARSSWQARIATLSVNAENTIAKSLYASFGFKAYGLERNSMYVNGVFIDEEHMSLEI